MINDDSMSIVKKDNVHVGLVLISLWVLFFPSHIIWSLSLIFSCMWSVFLIIKKDYKLSQHILAYSIILLYCIHLISGLWSNNSNLYVDAIRMKTALLGIPFCFIVWKKWTDRQLTVFSIGLLFAVLLSAIFVLINYSIHNNEILEGLLKGQPIPVPFKDHIRYVILICFSMLLTLHQMDYSRKKQIKFSFYTWLLFSILLFIYIQFLAVKTGMLLSILVVFGFIGHKMLERKKYILGSWIAVLFIGMLFVLLKIFPTMQNKLSYFAWDIGQYQENKYKNYSDGERIASIVHGYKIVLQHPILGVGEGNLPIYMQSLSNKIPHNQFIVVWAQNGILGFLSFIGIFLISFFIAIKNSNWLAFTYTLAMCLANMSEAMLETQLGLTIFLIPLLLSHAIQIEKPKISIF